MSKKNDRKSKMKERIKKNAQEATNKGPGYLKLPEGVSLLKIDSSTKITLDFLPYEVKDEKHLDKIDVGESWYKKPVKVHFGIGSENKSLVCPTTFGKPCPICEERNKLAADENSDEETVKALQPKYRIIYCVRPKTGKQEDEICIWEISYHNFQKLLDEELNDPDNDEYLSFPDAEGGFSVKIRFAEESFGKRSFAKADKISFTSRDDLDSDTLDKVINLDEIIKLLSYKEIQKLFLEVETEDEDEDEKPKNRKSKSTDEDEDENEKPKKRTRKNNDEDEDDEKPKKLKCPHGHKFGKNFDATDDCNDCDLWDECEEAS